MIETKLICWVHSFCRHQGDADSGPTYAKPGVDGPLLYNCTFPAMIASWRTRWAASTCGRTPTNLPFGFVQLDSNFAPSNYSGQPESNWTTAPDFDWQSSFYPSIRLAQTAQQGHTPITAMPNVFMAVAIDNAGGPHTTLKQVQGGRLARGALKYAYVKRYAALSFVGWCLGSRSSKMGTHPHCYCYHCVSTVCTPPRLSSGRQFQPVAD